MTLKQYTIESMSYLTTGMLDSGEEDASVEAAMCKVSYILRFDTPGKQSTSVYPAIPLGWKWGNRLHPLRLLCSRLVLPYSYHITLLWGGLVGYINCHIHD